MTIQAGTRLASYEILSPIGTGGMGEVYRACDLRLNRDVAIKILPPEVGGDGDRRRRFENEARAVAALNHPNILAIYDVGVDRDTSFIVTELLDGQSLRALLDAERLSTSRAIDLASQIADGLAAAHARGIVHRDLKPENVFVTLDGRAKILDFGLARTSGRSAATIDALTQSTTDPGTILGTMGYMSPEQARALPADHRADVFAFGTLLYEMLTGRRAFAGATAADTLSAILREAPTPIAQITDRPVSPGVLRIVDRCLEKSPEARFQSAADLAFALKSLSQADSTTSMSAARLLTADVRHRRWRLVPWIVAAAAIGLAIVAWQPWRTVGEAPAPPFVTFDIDAPAGTTFGPAADAPFPLLSPDGQYVLVAARTPDNAGHRYLISLAGGAPRMLPAGGLSAVWSPDGRSIVRTAGRGQTTLQRLDIETGAVRTICDLPQFAGVAWSPDGATLLLGGRGGLTRVAVTGGAPTPVTKAEEARNEREHRWPIFLPDGRHFLFQVIPGFTFWIGSLDDSTFRKQVLPATVRVAFAPPGWLVFVRDTTLFAQRFDLRRLETVEDPVVLAEEIGATEIGAAFSVSANGVLTYRVNPTPRRKFTWYDRKGSVLGTTQAPEDTYQGFAFLADEKSVVSHIHTSKGGGVWRIDLEQGTRTAITNARGDNNEPVLSPDGSSLVWRRREQPRSILRRLTNGIGDEQSWITLDNLSLAPTHWSARYLVFGAVAGPSLGDIWYAPVDGAARPVSYLSTSEHEARGVLSPDEKWMAYQTGGGNDRQVFVSPFPNASGGRWLVSGAGGGSWPRWNGNDEIIYAGPDGQVMSAALTVRNGSITSVTRELFRVPGTVGGDFTFTRDGQRFLVGVPRPEDQVVRLKIVVNWERLVGR